MLDVTLICCAALLGAAPDAGTLTTAESVFAGRPSSGVAASSIASSPPVFTPAAGWDEVVIRAQSFDSPYYDELGPPVGGPQLPQYPYTPSSPPMTAPGGAPTFGGTPGFGSPAPSPVGPTPYDPFVGQPPGAVPPGGTIQYGVNGPQPYRFGPQPRIDIGYIVPANANSGYGDVDVFELDLDVPIASPTGIGNVFTFTPEFNTRMFDGPSPPIGQPGFPNDLYRFGWDFAYSWQNPRGWSGELAFNPSINTDFEKSLDIDAVNWDARGIGFLPVSPTLTLALGAMYWDRVDDRILPYAGVIWLPNDRWELRLVFPEPRISYFIGHLWGRPTWVYARAEYDVEAWQVESPDGVRNQLEMSDWRLMFGARKEQSWGQTFVEIGWVFDRQIEYAHTAPSFEFGEAFLLRGGLRF